MLKKSQREKKYSISCPPSSANRHFSMWFPSTKWQTDSLFRFFSPQQLSFLPNPTFFARSDGMRFPSIQTDSLTRPPPPGEDRRFFLAILNRYLIFSPPPPFVPPSFSILYFYKIDNTYQFNTIFRLYFLFTNNERCRHYNVCFDLFFDHNEDNTSN